MASQITHVTYGQLVLDKFLKGRKDLSLRDFFIGTLFPDIRFLGTIPREKVHIENPTVNELLKQEGSFRRGFYTHSLIDLERERVLEKLGFYKLFPIEKNLQRAGKLFEDQITFLRWKNWDTIKSYLGDVLPEELKIADETAVQRWHGILKSYFSVSPTTDSALGLARQLGFSEEIIQEIKQFMLQIQRSQKAVSIISRIQENLFVK